MNQYGIAVFHNRGDVVSATPIARQLREREPGCRITWFTSTMTACVLDHNPDVDEVVVLGGKPEDLDRSIPQLRSSRPWTRFFTPAAYMNYAALPGGAIFELVKASAQLEWTVPFQFRLRLSPEEVAAARRYWARLPQGPRILIETEFLSSQSPWNEDYLCDLVAALRDLDPLLVLTSRAKPAFLDHLLQIHPRTVWCREPFRLNAELFNLCDAFVGVSSGISALTYSDWCRTDVPRIEVARGEHWSGAVLGLHSRLSVCYSRRRFQQALARWRAELQGAVPPAWHATPRVPVACDAEERQCPQCGGTRARPFLEGSLGGCDTCGLLHTRARGPLLDRRLATPVADAGPVPQAGPELDTPARDTLHQGLLAEALGAWGGAPDRAGVLLLGDACSGLGATLRRSGLHAAHVPDRLVPRLGDGMATGSLDVLFAPHVLDRVEEPLDLLDRLGHLLRPGGVLLLTVPNIASLGVSLFRFRWPWWEPTRRISHFTPKTLRDLIRQSGLSIARVATAVGEAGMPMALEALRLAHPQASPERLRALLPPLHAMGGGEELQVLVRKAGVGVAWAGGGPRGDQSPRPHTVGSDSG